MIRYIIALTILFLISMSFAAHGQNQRPPKLWWGDDEVVMSCAEISDAKVYLITTLFRAKVSAGSCKPGTAGCYAESVVASEASRLLRFLDRLEGLQCPRASRERPALPIG